MKLSLEAAKDTLGKAKTVPLLVLVVSDVINWFAKYRGFLSNVIFLASRSVEYAPS